MPVIVVHCGAGSTIEVADAAEMAAETGWDVLRAGGAALDAVVEAVVALEDDERTNAGTGSRLNLDGVAEMDASIMTSDLRCGAVAAIRDVKNPIRVARDVMKSPHVLLCGDGAVKFARKSGHARFDPSTPRSREILEQMKGRLASGDLPVWASAWNEYRTGTVGAVARDEKGRMAASNSTGGVYLKLPGRVGDTPLIGCGIFAGPLAAVTATGIGEEIIRRTLSRVVYDRIAAGSAPQEACEEGVDLFQDEVPVGIVAVDESGWGAAANTEMAWRARER